MSCHHDAKHRKTVSLILNHEGIGVRNATDEEDLAGICDLWMIDSAGDIPVACKRRGDNSQADIPLTLVSAANPSKILEAGCAGDKFIMVEYTRERIHRFYRLPSQKYIDSLIPPQRELIEALDKSWNRRWVSFTNGQGGCRRNSIGSDQPQAMLFIPRDKCLLVKEWTYDEVDAMRVVS